MVDGPRGRGPFQPGGDRPTRGSGPSTRGTGGNRRDSAGGNTNSSPGGTDHRGHGPGGGDHRGNGPGSDQRGNGPSQGRGQQGTFYDRGRREGGAGDNRQARPGGDRFVNRGANPQTIQHRAVHYQVVTMDDDEWGDTLEHRLNALGRDGWRLVAIDDGRQYVFMQAD